NYFVEENGRQFLVMDYIEGDDLETLREKRGALPEEDVRRWFQQIFNAVVYLHHEKVIHRDIKPENIKITPNGQAVLVDFGLAVMHCSDDATISNKRGG